MRKQITEKINSKEILKKIIKSNEVEQQYKKYTLSISESLS